MSERFLVTCLNSMSRYWHYGDPAQFDQFDTCLINYDYSHLAGVPEKYWKPTAEMDGLEEMPQAEKDAVDLAELTATKEDRYDRIDAVTNYLIEEGFLFGTPERRFSMSAHAQLNWTQMVVASNSLTWPQEITTQDPDNPSYLLQQAELPAFIMAVAGHKDSCLEAGRQHKVTIAAMTDVAAVESWEDPRLIALRGD